MTQKPKLSPSQVRLLRRVAACSPEGASVFFGSPSIHPLRRWGLVAGDFRGQGCALFVITDAGRAALAAIEAAETRADLATINAQEDTKL